MKNKSGIVLLQICCQPGTLSLFIPIQGGKNNLQFLFNGKCKDIFHKKRESLASRDKKIFYTDGH